MARIEQVIHVKDTDGVVRECALFDSASDIPSGTPDRLAARKFGLNGADIYGAVLDALDGEAFVFGSDDAWLSNNATELAFHDGSSSLRLLTTPYFVRPKTEPLEFGADGGTVYLEDSLSKIGTYEGILSTNGTYAGYSCDHDFVSLVNESSARLPVWAVVCEANTTASERSFTLTLTYVFADGSTQDITFTGIQAAAEEKEAWLRVDPDSLSFGADGRTGMVVADSSAEVSAGDCPDWLAVTRITGVAGSGAYNVRIACEANTETSARTGAVTLSNGDGCTAEVAVTQEGAGFSGGGVGTGDTRTLTIDISKTGSSLADSDWSRLNVPSCTVTVDGKTVGGITVTATSTTSAEWTGEVDYGATAHYEVAKDGYVTVTGSVTMDEDRTVSVSLRLDI